MEVVMRKSIKVLVVILTFLFSFNASSKSAEEWAEELGYDLNVSYDATRVMEAKEGRFSQKIHHAPGKLMTETNAGGMQRRIIMREDLGKSYMIMPSMGMYQEMNIHQGMEQSGQSMDYHTVEKVGTETVNGFKTTKYKTKFEDANGKGAGFIWITEEGINIKSDMIYASTGMKGQRMKMELADINVRAQDSSLFEIPPGLQRMDTGNMSGIMDRNQQSQGTTTANQEPGIVDEMGEAAEDETRRGMVDETREAVKKGLKGLFGK